ncbi:MAG: AMP-binding protein [Candidatus Rokubacteria bacterium]|nr:AMP-binding protein [Candidatus Rokubacteria bacterium]
MLQQNFAYLVDKRREVCAQDVAVVEAHSGRRHTYDDLCRRARALAAGLQAEGIRRGDCICCLTGNTVEYLHLFLAAARLGAMVSPINHRLSSSDAGRILADARPRVFVFDRALDGLARELVGDGSQFGRVLSFGDGDSRWADDLETWVARYPDDAGEIAGDSEDPLLLLYTAGSTGTPKGVPLRQSHLFFNAINWIIDVGIGKRDYGLTVIPLFHIGGHMLWTLPHLIVGGRVLLQRRFEPEETLRLLSQERITNAFLLPTMLKMMLAVPGWREYDLGSLRFIGAGGEPVPERITRAFAEIGIPVLNAYGLTETSDGTTVLRPEHAATKPANCVGKPLTMVDVRIVDGAGRDVGPGVEGELLHRGPSVVDAYWKKPEETGRAFRDGWFRTGDRAVRDEEGFIHFLGRKDELIITGGENVYPAEVEEAILSHPGVADVAVVGVPDEQWGQTIKAIIAPRGGVTLTEGEIAEHLQGRLSRFKRPRIVEFTDSLPKMGSGKLDRVRIRVLYAAGADGRTPPLTP